MLCCVHDPCLDIVEHTPLVSDKNRQISENQTREKNHSQERQQQATGKSPMQECLDAMRPNCWGALPRSSPEDVVYVVHRLFNFLDTLLPLHYERLAKVQVVLHLHELNVPVPVQQPLLLVLLSLASPV